MYVLWDLSLFVARHATQGKASRLTPTRQIDTWCTHPGEINSWLNLVSWLYSYNIILRYGCSLLACRPQALSSAKSFHVNESCKNSISVWKLSLRGRVLRGIVWRPSIVPWQVPCKYSIRPTALSCQLLPWYATCRQCENSRKSSVPAAEGKRSESSLCTTDSSRQRWNIRSMPHRLHQWCHWRSMPLWCNRLERPPRSQAWLIHALHVSWRFATIRQA